MTGSGSGSLPPPYATDPFFSPMIKEMVFLMKFLAETLSNGLPAHATRCLLGCSFCLRRSTFLSFLKGRRIRRSAFTLPPPTPTPPSLSVEERSLSSEFRPFSTCLGIGSCPTIAWPPSSGSSPSTVARHQLQRARHVSADAIALPTEMDGPLDSVVLVDNDLGLVGLSHAAGRWPGDPRRHTHTHTHTQKHTETRTENKAERAVFSSEALT